MHNKLLPYVTHSSLEAEVDALNRKRRQPKCGSGLWTFKWVTSCSPALGSSVKSSNIILRAVKEEHCKGKIQILYYYNYIFNAIH